MSDYLLEASLSGALLRSCGVLVIVPITHNNVSSIQSDDLVWDDKLQGIVCYSPDIFEEDRFYIADKDSLIFYKNLAERYDRRF